MFSKQIYLLHDDYTDCANNIYKCSLSALMVVVEGSIYTTMTISIERYITVCHPFFKLSHNWSANKYILPILVLCILYNIPKYFELQVQAPDTMNLHYPV